MFYFYLFEKSTWLNCAILPGFSVEFELPYRWIFYQVAAPIVRGDSYGKGKLISLIASINYVKLDWRHHRYLKINSLDFV